jgi:hypothetical protein
MNRHERAVREALEAFCREYTGRDSGWRVETWLHPVTRSVQSVVVMPEFAAIDFSERVELLLDHLQARLTREGFQHLGLVKPLTPEEYEGSDWMPTYAQPTLAPG